MSYRFKRFLKGAATYIILLAIVFGAFWVVLHDTPVKFSLGKTEFDLSYLKVDDLLNEGYTFKNNDRKIYRHTYHELANFYNADNMDVPVGALSIYNDSSEDSTFAKCYVFEVAVRLYDDNGNPTNVDFKYEGKEVLGKTASEIKEMLGEPASIKDDEYLYLSKKKKYESYFRFDESGICYRVEMDRKDDRMEE